MSETYTKLFSSIVTSTIWSEPDKTRIVWITMLAMADKHGEVFASVPGLARMANVSIEDCQAAIDRFLSPDPFSRTPDAEGRRIAKIEGGWALINHAKYRHLASTEDAREKNAERQRRHRKSVTHSNASVTVDTRKAEAEAEANPLDKKTRKAKATLEEVQQYCVEANIPAQDAEWFFYKCEGSGWRNGGEPIKDWRMTLKAWERANYLPSQKGKAQFNPPPKRKFFQV